MDRKKLSRKISFSLIVFLIFPFLFCQVQTAVAKEIYVAIGTAGTGGLWYPTAAAIAKVWNKYLSGEVKGTAVTSRGGTENLMAMNSGKRLSGFTSAIDSYQSYTGTGRYRDTIYRNASVGYCPAQTLFGNTWTTKQKGIRTIEDIKGKRFCIPSPGGLGRVVADIIFPAHGLQLEKDVKLSYGNMSIMNDRLTMGQIDVAFWVTGLRASALLSFSETKDIFFVPLTEEGIKQAQRKRPTFINTEIPANTYRGQTKAVKTVGIPMSINISPKLDEEIVYKMAKTMWEHIDEVYETTEHAKQIKLDSSLFDKMPIPYHPGVMRYFKEKKIPGIKEYEKRMQKVIALRKANLVKAK